jgi:hypothetical protein
MNTTWHSLLDQALATRRGVKMQRPGPQKNSRSNESRNLLGLKDLRTRDSLVCCPWAIAALTALPRRG